MCRGSTHTADVVSANKNIHIKSLLQRHGAPGLRRNGILLAIDPRPLQHGLYINPILILYRFSRATILCFFRHKLPWQTLPVHGSQTHVEYTKVGMCILSRYLCESLCITCLCASVASVCVVTCMPVSRPTPDTGKALLNLLLLHAPLNLLLRH